MEFISRHLGPDSAEQATMLAKVGYDSVDALVDAAIPSKIRAAELPQLPEALSEDEAQATLREYANQNTVLKSFYGQGFSDTLTPAVIRRGLLEDAGWYTAYTPYQPEISQGRLEALLNFQTMIESLTGLPIANASLLDEASATAEAVGLMSRAVKKGRRVVLIGHAGHPEVEGTMGQADDGIYLVETEADVERLQVPEGVSLAYVTQTTLSMDDTSRVIDALRSKYPSIGGPRKDDICYATQNRQDAVKQLADECDVVLVVGSPNSSNSNRLRELAERMNTPAYLIDGAEDLKREWFESVERIGITAGASAPEVLVRGVIERLKEWGASGMAELEGRPENVTFSMPKELRVKAL